MGEATPIRKGFEFPNRNAFRSRKSISKRAWILGRVAKRAWTRRHRSMHPRNVYRDKPLDWEGLVARHPALKPHWKPVRPGSERRKFAWNSYEASVALAKALLLEDFGVEWNLPSGYLCPSLPNRTNYVHWIEDLLQLAGLWERGQTGPSVQGIDVGCGANCVYALLGASIHGWSFVAVDVHEGALKAARDLVERNPQLQPLIQVRDARESVHYVEGESILRSALLPGERVAFTMCNPPFFATGDEAGLNPRTDFGGTMQEMVCPGGEEEFVKTMVMESLDFKTRVHWFTTMVGKKKTLKSVRKLLHALNVPGLRTTEFVQGRTHRWGIAWSFQEDVHSAMKPLRSDASVASSKRRREHAEDPPK